MKLNSVMQVVHFVAVAAMAFSVGAAEYTWVGADPDYPDSWSMPKNWAHGANRAEGLPSYSDTVVFDIGENNTLSLVMTNTSYGSSWPNHRVYKFMSGTVYLRRRSSSDGIYFHGGGYSPEPEIYVGEGATVVCSNSITQYGNGSRGMTKTGKGTFIQHGSESKTINFRGAPMLDVREGSWFMETENSYGCYFNLTNLIVRDGATFKIEGYNCFPNSPAVTLEAGSTFLAKFNGGDGKFGCLNGGGDIRRPGTAASKLTINGLNGGISTFTGSVYGVAVILARNSSVPAGDFRFYAGGNTFQNTTLQDDGYLGWAPDVTDAILHSYSPQQTGVVIPLANRDGEPVNLTIDSLGSPAITRTSGAGTLTVTSPDLTVTNDQYASATKISAPASRTLTFGNGTPEGDAVLANLVEISAAGALAFSNYAAALVPAKVTGSGNLTTSGEIAFDDLQRSGGTLTVGDKVTINGGTSVFSAISFAGDESELVVNGGYFDGGKASDAYNYTPNLKIPEWITVKSATSGTMTLNGGEIFLQNEESSVGGIHHLAVNEGARLTVYNYLPTSRATAGDPSTILIDGGEYFGRTTSGANYSEYPLGRTFDDLLRVYIGEKGAKFGIKYGVRGDASGVYFRSALRTAPGIAADGGFEIGPGWHNYMFGAPILLNGPIAFRGGRVVVEDDDLIETYPAFFGTGSLTLESSSIGVLTPAATHTLRIASGTGSTFTFGRSAWFTFRTADNVYSVDGTKAAQHIVVGPAGAAANSVLRRKDKGSALFLHDAVALDGAGSSFKVNGGVETDANTGIVRLPVYEFTTAALTARPLTCDAENRLVSIPASAYVTSFAEATSAKVLNATGSIVLNKDAEAHAAAFVVNNWQTATLSEGSRLVVGNGSDPALVSLSGHGQIAGSGTIDFRTSEGVIAPGQHPYGSTISARLSGSNGITFIDPQTYGGHFVNLTGDNDYSGGTWISVVRVHPQTSTAFGSGTVHVLGDECFGGRVYFDRPVTLANDFHLSGWDSWPSMGGVSHYGELCFATNGIVLSGNIWIDDFARIGSLPTMAVDARLDGVISGGELEVRGVTGHVLFANHNTYAKGTILSNARLSVAYGDGLGTGPVRFDNGTLVFENTTPVTFTNSVEGVGTIVLAGTAPVTFAGEGFSGLTFRTLAAGSVLDVASAANNVYVPHFEGATDLGGENYAVAGVAGTGVIENGTLTVTGEINPGGAGAVGTLAFAEGVLIPDGATYVCDVVGNAADKLVFGGALDLSTLSFRAVRGDSACGQAKVLEGVELTGAFSTVTMPRRSWTLDYGASEVTLNIDRGFMMLVR